MRSAIVVGIAGSLGWTAAWAAAESATSAAAPAVHEEISVDLVNLAVHATGADGRPVVDLPREAFRLFEGGQQLEITHFAWVDGSVTAASANRGDGDVPGAAVGTGRSDPADPRGVTIYFDELQIGNRNRAPLLRALHAALSRQLRPGDRVSVVRFDGADVETLLPFTTDRGRLLKAFEDLGAVSVQRVTAALELESWMRLLENDVRAREGGPGCPDAGVILRGYADLVKRNVEYSAYALLRYSIRFSHEPGQKLLLHVSDGIPLIAGGEAYEYAISMCDCSALAQGITDAGCVDFDSDPSDAGNTRDRFDPRKGRIEMLEYTTAQLWSDVAARVNALGVTIYPLQVAESGSQFLPDAELGRMPVAAKAMAEQNPVDTLELLARETGGILARGGRGIEDEVGRLVGGIGSYYSIAFRPEPDRSDGLRRLKLEVDRPGVELRYRQSYRLMSRDERISLRLAELLEPGALDNPLAIDLSIARRAEQPGTRRLRVQVPFEKLTMVDLAEGSAEGRFTVYVALRPEGERAPELRRRSIVARRSSPATAAYTYEVELPASARDLDVAVAVVDDYSGTVAFARETVEAR